MVTPYSTIKKLPIVKGEINALIYQGFSFLVSVKVLILSRSLVHCGGGSKGDPNIAPSLCYLTIGLLLQIQTLGHSLCAITQTFPLRSQHWLRHCAP